MAGFLGKYTKIVLLELAQEFDTDVSEANKKRQIIDAIAEASDYEEQYARDCLGVILENEKKTLEREREALERKEREREREKEDREREREREEREREKEDRDREREREDRDREREREDRDREREREDRDREMEREDRERERERTFELEKLRIQNANEINSIHSNASTDVITHAHHRVNLKDYVPKLDLKASDITLFFLIFERQAERLKISENDYVSQLLPLLPPDLAEIVVKEPREKSDDYMHIKGILLKRFRLSTGALKSKFHTHQKKPGAAWTELVYELRSYLENWLQSTEVEDFEALKELMIAEQIKKRVPLEIKDKYLDVWDEIKNATDVAEKCDKYENVRAHIKKPEKKFWERPNVSHNQNKNSFTKHKSDPKIKNDSSGNRPEKGNENWRRERPYEKARPVTCYFCSQPGHIKPNCPELKKNIGLSVHHIEDKRELESDFGPYLKLAKINGIERQYLRDTGSNIDVCDPGWILEGDLIGEVVWIKQPLEHELKCLPLAWVTIESGSKKIITKAAVKPTGYESGYYILGNGSAKLMEESENINSVNAIMTRSQCRKERGEQISEKDSKPEPDLNEESELEIPLLGEENNPPLAEISAEKFVSEQKKCDTLNKLRDEAENNVNSEFQIKEGRLVRVTVSKRQDERVQLCVPVIFRNEILKLCHEQVAGHLGTTKTKDRVLRNYFWPNCYKEIENYVRSCLPCQKVGNNRDKEKAPMKVVPIISEVFSKLVIDAVGPLPSSENENKYLITALCVASKYPDAIPVKNISSPEVIGALLNIMSRTGYPKEIQCDLGKSFTSQLTTEFFHKFGIKVRHSSVCHPQSNSVERFHSSLKRVLKALCLETGKDWETILPMALFALRTVTHESTGFSPTELVHGKNLRLPHTIVYENWMGNEGTDQNVVDYVLNLINRLKMCQDLAEKEMIRTRDKRKLWYDRNAVLRKFKIGDKVLVLATSKPNKMCVNWIGPGTVTSVISETNYTVDLPEKRDKSTIYHVNLMKPYHSRPEYVNLVIESVMTDVNSIENDAEIPYPLTNSTQMDFWEIIKENNLEESMNAEQLEKFRNILDKHQKTFSSDPGLTQLLEMDIVLEDETPVRAKPYRMSPRQTEILREEIKRLLDLGVIEVGQSDFASPMILVESPGKPPRPCVDYRKLNAKTRTEFFPLPNIEQVVETVSAAPFITLMDLSKGYFQIPLTKRAQRYAAFVTPFGSFLPRVMMFGLKNSGFCFCNLMANVLGGLEAFALPYIDDVAIFSKSADEHLRHIDEVLGRIKNACLTIKPSKCKFAQKSVKFLGHEVGSGMRSPSQAKVQAILDFPIPKNKTQLRAFLGTAGYYSRYVENYAKIASPLTDALKGKIKKEKIEWSNQCNAAFEELKAKLTKSPILFAPDFKKLFILQTDASLQGAGIVLSQESDGQEHPIVYLSKKFSRAEQNYSTIERELAAIIYGIRKLNHYLDGQKFKIQTDHNPLVFLKKMVGTNARLTRWALCLQQYDFEVEHKPGRLNGNADGLSRKG